MAWRLFILPLLLGAGGCLSGEIYREALPPVTAGDQAATIVVLREDKSAWREFPIFVGIDGHDVAVLSIGTYVEISVDPGEHLVAISGQNGAHRKVFSLNLGPRDKAAIHTAKGSLFAALEEDMLPASQIPLDAAYQEIEEGGYERIQ